MKYSKISLTFLLFALFANTANANIYKCKKLNGTTQYSDRPCTKGLKQENIRTIKKSAQGIPAAERNAKSVSGSSSKVIGTWSCIVTGGADIEQSLQINADGSFLETANLFGSTLGAKGSWKKDKNALTFFQKISIENNKEKLINQEFIKTIKDLTISKLVTDHKDGSGLIQETVCTKR